ncbi:MAG: DUF2834 domain-containing protein [Cyanobacteria bacterium P01_A01_bin.116]
MTDLSVQKKTHQSPTRTQSLRGLYLVLSILSLVVSWGIAGQFLVLDTASVGTFFQQAFGSPVATLVSSDVVLSALILLAFIRVELKRLGLPQNRLIVYVLATCSVGVCFALSLFLYQREKWITNP